MHLMNDIRKMRMALFFAGWLLGALESKVVDCTKYMLFNSMMW